MSGKIKYRDMRDYKYLLAEDATFDTGVRLDVAVEIPGYIAMAEDGRMVVSAGYAWDGPSGPAIDTKSFMRASLFHDAGYQLIRARRLGDSYRAKFDALMRRIARQDGMGLFRGWYTWAGVRVGAWWATAPKNREPQDVVLTAP